MPPMATQPEGSYVRRRARQRKAAHFIHAYVTVERSGVKQPRGVERSD